MKHPNTDGLKELLRDVGQHHRVHLEHFDDLIHDAEFETHRDQIREQQAHLTDDQVDEIARLWCLCKYETPQQQPVPPVNASSAACVYRPVPRWLQILFGILVILLLSKIAFGQAVVGGQGVGDTVRGDQSFTTIGVECPNCSGPISVQAGLPAIGLPTYSASTSGTLASNPTDIAVLSGNAQNTVVVSGITVSCTQTTGGIVGIMLLKRSAADTGTSVPITTGPNDSKNAVAVSSALFYAANPTLGATVAVMDQKKILIPAVTSTTANQEYVWRPGLGQSIDIRSGEQLAINFGGQTIGGAACAVNIQWVETNAF